MKDADFSLDKYSTISVFNNHKPSKQAKVKAVRNTFSYRNEKMIPRNLFSYALIIFGIFVICSKSEGTTEKQISDAILERKTYSEQDLNKMDFNNDGCVDVADLVKIKRNVVVEFNCSVSEIDENAGTHNIEVNFSKSVNGMPLAFTIGGTAEEEVDFFTLPRTVIANGNSAEIVVPIISDTIYEGNESIVLNLLPGADYLLGVKRTHTIKLNDNPYESTADYICILATQTMGLEGDTTNQTGFPATMFSRTASIAITFSQAGNHAASLNVPKSIGIADNVSQSDFISASSVTYDGTTGLTMIFEYETESESFVSDASITDFDYDDPALGDQTKKRLSHTLTLIINETADEDTYVPFELSRDKFTGKLLKGTFSIQISGVLNDNTPSLLNGLVSATLQQ